jgi:hypothetical protein
MAGESPAAVLASFFLLKFCATTQGASKLRIRHSDYVNGEAQTYGNRCIKMEQSILVAFRSQPGTPDPKIMMR